MPPRSAERDRDSRSRSPSSKHSKKEKKDKKDKTTKKEEKQNRASRLNEPEDVTSSSNSEADALEPLPASTTAVSVDLLNSVLTSVNAITAELKTMNKDIGDVRRELQSQRKQVDTMISQMTRMHEEAEHSRAAFKEEMALTNDSINKKLADFEQRLSRTAADSSQATGSSASAVAGAPRGRSAPPPRSPAANRSEARSEVAHKVLVIGFPRALPKKALEKHNETTMAQYLRDNPTFSAPVFFGTAGTMYSLGFASGLELGNFMRWYRTNRSACRWKDKNKANDMEDEPGTFHDIVYKTPAEPAARARGLALSPYHRFLAEHLSKSPAWTEATLHRTRPDKGTITIESDDELWVPFKIELNDSRNEVTMDTATLTHFGFSVDQIRAYVAKAAAEGQAD
jgi:hypothetical protein